MIFFIIFISLCTLLRLLWRIFTRTCMIVCDIQNKNVCMCIVVQRYLEFLHASIRPWPAGKKIIIKAIMQRIHLAFV